MAGVPSPRAQLKVRELGELLHKVQRVYGLIEQLAAARVNQAQYLPPVKRGLERLKLDFMGASLDQLSQLAGALAIGAGRGSVNQHKIKMLRDGIGSMKFQIELEQRSIVAADKAEQEKGAGAGPAE